MNARAAAAANGPGVARRDACRTTSAEAEKIVHDALEKVCRHGCRHVLQTIAAMERGEMPGELSGLTPDLRRRALDELQAIMAVYDRECSLDPGEAL